MKKKHLGVLYQKMTVDSVPLEGDVLYRLPQPEDGDVEPLKMTVTKWGATCHFSDHIIEVLQEYPESFKTMIRNKYKDAGRKEKKELEKDLLPRKTFIPLNKLFKKLD